MAQEPAGGQLDHNELVSIAFLAAACRVKAPSNRRSSGRRHPKGGEVMLAQQPLNPRVHGRDVKRLGHMQRARPP
jgi:hypothetical protein